MHKNGHATCINIASVYLERLARRRNGVLRMYFGLHLKPDPDGGKVRWWGDDAIFLSGMVRKNYNLKGLSHEIFGPVFWPVWMHLGLNRNRFWLLNFKETPLI